MAKSKLFQFRLALMEWVVKLSRLQFSLILGSAWAAGVTAFIYCSQTTHDPWYVFIPSMFLVGLVFGVCMRPFVLWSYRRAIKRMREDSN